MSTPEALFAPEQVAEHLVQHGETPWRTTYVHFREFDNVLKFGAMIGRQLSETSEFVWCPPASELAALIPDDFDSAWDSVMSMDDEWSAEFEAEEQEDLIPSSDAPSVSNTPSAGPSMFEVHKWWEEWWLGMPHFSQEDLNPKYSIRMQFRCHDDMQMFGKLLGQSMSDQTRAIWFPKEEIGWVKNKRWVSPIQPKYPIFVISKGRWKSQYTHRALVRMGVPHYVVCEPKEAKLYEASLFKPANIIVAPENFSERGQGSIPVRNFVWDQANAMGVKRHWCLDDNIRLFYRLDNNEKMPAATGAMFRAAEDFSDRFSNVGISGFHYFMFAPRKKILPPFIWNSRVYSCILIRNDIQNLAGLSERWRGRYNEDTDLSLRALKAGQCTALFFAFLACKMETMSMKGGNTDELYNKDAMNKSHELLAAMKMRNNGDERIDGKWLHEQSAVAKEKGLPHPFDPVLWNGDGRLRMAYHLWEQHPDVMPDIVWKWGRWQHHVDYRSFEYMFSGSQFNNPHAPVPKYAPGVVGLDSVNEYEMTVEENDKALYENMETEKD